MHKMGKQNKHAIGQPHKRSAAGQESQSECKREQSIFQCQQSQDDADQIQKSNNINSINADSTILGDPEDLLFDRVRKQQNKHKHTIRYKNQPRDKHQQNWKEGQINYRKSQMIDEADEKLMQKSYNKMKIEENVKQENNIQNQKLANKTKIVNIKLEQNDHYCFRDQDIDNCPLCKVLFSDEHLKVALTWPQLKYYINLLLKRIEKLQQQVYQFIYQHQRRPSLISVGSQTSIKEQSLKQQHGLQVKKHLPEGCTSILQINQESQSIDVFENSSILYRRRIPKKNRRKAEQIKRTYKCLFQNCQKQYGSKSAVKIHMKEKHNICKATLYFTKDGKFQIDRSYKKHQKLCKCMQKMGQIKLQIARRAQQDRKNNNQ